MSKSGRPGGGLHRGIDQEIYAIITKWLSKEENAADTISVAGIYDFIKRSNSSLARRPKILLESSIERVIPLIVQQSSSEDEDVDGEDQRDNLSSSANAMNRSIVKAMTPKHKGSETPDGRHSDSNGLKNGDVVRKQKQETAAKSSRSLKRKRGKEVAEEGSPAPANVSLSDIGGMEHVIEQLEDCLLLPLGDPEHFIRQGTKIPRGILLHGPPGCGKTMLCEAVAAELGLPFWKISAPSIVSGMSGESEKQLRQHFENALQSAPSIMFIDEIDAITPKRESAQREMERRIVGQLLTCMDDLALEKTGGRPVIVLAATNRPDSLDPALRRAGRFDTEINIGVPLPAVRAQILKAQTRKMRLAEDVDFDQLAKSTPGFVGADLESLVYKAGAAANVRYKNALKALSAQREMDTEAEPITPELKGFRQLQRMLFASERAEELSDDPVTMKDFVAAIPLVQPSAKREGFATIPETTWSNVGALTEVRQQLNVAIVEPISKPEKYERFGISIPAGVLLWGPPGCGKTLLAKAVANESRANFISVKGPELLNKYVGESERAVRQVFLRAQSSIPCVIFFDELDALVPRRDDSLSEASARVVNTLLTELDGISNRKGIYVIAATNRPEMIDAAMLRPGRLGKHLFVGLPGEDERAEILVTLLRKMPVDSNISFTKVAERCQGFSGADLSNLVHEAAVHAVGRDANHIEALDFDHASSQVRPSVGDMTQYDRFRTTMK